MLSTCQYYYNDFTVVRCCTDVWWPSMCRAPFLRSVCMTRQVTLPTGSQHAPVGRRVGPGWRRGQNPIRRRVFLVLCVFKWYEALSRSQHCYDLFLLKPCLYLSVALGGIWRSGLCSSEWSLLGWTFQRGRGPLTEKSGGVSVFSHHPYLRPMGCSGSVC